MKLYIDTCVLPRCRLEEAAVYRERYGDGLGFEILPMFDLVDFEDDLERNVQFFEKGPVIFHEPVWGVEHTAPKGTEGYEESMLHLRLTAKYAEILRPHYMVYHLNNCAVAPGYKESLLETSLENLREMREMFPGVGLLVENTGTEAGGDRLLDQDEYTRLIIDKGFESLVDIGHANCNGWDIRRLVRDLKDNVRGFHVHNNDGVHDQHRRIGDGTLDIMRLIEDIAPLVPDAHWVIEYTRPEYHGAPLLEDIENFMKLF